LFIFLMLYIGVTLLSVSIHWHVALELIKGAYSHKPSLLKNWVVIALFICSSLVAVLKFDSLHPDRIVMYWLQLRFFAEIAIVFLGFFFFRRHKT
jgi:spore germination protein KB